MGIIRRFFDKRKKTDTDEAESTGQSFDEILVTSQESESLDDTLEIITPPTPGDVDTQEATLVPEQPARSFKREGQPFHIGTASHVGQVRKRNEDFLLAITSSAQGESSLPPFGLFIVADGMGGHSEGQMASQVAARTVAHQVMSQVYVPFLKIDVGEPADPVQYILGKALQNANWKVNTFNSDSGTTLTAVLVVGSRLYVAHVGDSRAYLFRDDDSPGELLTLDHSFVQRLLESGQITPEEAAIHPQRNILYRAIGQGEKLDIDTFTRPLPESCWLLICSDGLWGVVPRELIKEIITSSASPQDACDELVLTGLERGGPDNITAIIVHFQSKEPE